MYKIQNKKTSMSRTDAGKTTPRDTTYADLIKDCVNLPPGNGMSISEMRDRFKIIDILEASNKERRKEFSLENNLFAIVKSCVEQTSWISLNRELIEFYDYITGLKEEAAKKK